jgi:purine-nucleoside phosphorylase
VRTAEEQGLRFHVGNVFSADLFYPADTSQLELMERNNILGVEMETAGIYAIAAELGAEALAICTVSDDIKTGAKLSSKERQTSFDAMIELALDAAVPA